MPGTLPRYFLLLVVLALGIVLVLVSVEFGLRATSGEKTGKTNYLPHPTAIASYRPFIDKQKGRKSARYPFRTNAMGLRDNEPFCQDADVLLFGDSNFAAEFLPFEQTLGEKLEALFDNTICVANYGTPGYGPDQSLSRMTYEIDKQRLTPAVIVLHVFTDNDYGDMLRNRLFTIDDTGALKRTDRESMDFKLRWIERYQAQYLLVRRLRDFAVKQGFYGIGKNEYYPDRHGAFLARPLNSELQSNSFLRQVEAITSDEYRQYRDGKHTTWLGDLYDYWIALNPDSEAAQVAEKLLTSVITAAKKKSQEVGACLVVLIQPAEWDVAETGPVTHADLARYSRTRQRNYHPENLTRIAVNAATASGASYINLFDVFTAPGTDAYTSYRFDGGDNHWNESGISTAAVALQQFITGNNCLKPEGNPG